MKVSELSGAKLDYWVARANGNDSRDADLILNSGYRPSSNWAHGGVLIERERLVVGPTDGGEWIAYADNATILNTGSDTITGSNTYGAGPTPLIAAMRAYVTHKFGRDVSDEAVA